MMKQTYALAASARMTKTLSYIELVGLTAITIATVLASMSEIAKMIAVSQVSLADLLLLFIYLEVLSMVAIYLESGALPVRVPLYIAIVALARHLILGTKAPSGWEIIATVIAILILALAVLVIRYGHIRFPYEIPREK